MDLFLRHELVQVDNGYMLTLYVNRFNHEFANELNIVNETEKKENLTKRVKQYIKDHFPNKKIIGANILVGSLLFSTIDLDKASAHHDPGFNMSYLYFGGSANFIKQVDRTQGNLSVASPSYFDLNADGSLKLTSQLDKNFVDEMHSRGIKVVPFLSNHWDRDLGRSALQNRERLATQIAEAIEKNNLEGVNVDIENVTDVDREDYTDLVRLLREKIPKDKEVSVAVAANPNGWNKGWHGSYDYNELAKYADYLMIMAYDESYSGGPQGPVASYPWVERSIQYALNEGVPGDKIVLGVPFFGRYWIEGEATGGTGISKVRVEELLSKYSGKVVYDDVAKSPKAIITILPTDEPTIIAGKVLKPGTYHIWYENEASIAAKLELVHKYSLRGTGSWSLGQENTAIWNEYAVWLRGDSTPVSAATEQEDLTIPEPAENTTNPFNDINGHWAYDSILSVQRKGWIKGKDAQTFAPEEKLTRAQAAVILVRVLELKPIGEIGTSSYKDIANNHWALTEIEIARQHGIIKGRTDGTFGQNEPITREQMAVILDRSLNVTNQKANLATTPFKDVTKKRWSYESIAIMNQLDVFNGYNNGTFGPTDPIKRSQMAALLDRSAEVISPTATLKVGSKGEEVTILQKKLNHLGLFNATYTDTYGTITEQAVRTFQANNGLTVDGVTGPKTMKKINELLRTDRLKSS